ncbi:olfactory receptor 2T1 [Fukomys damarensis]|uniref:olfactory receptor 2T1 n=1 Tax=Fukomys damarensis TaxID=885580 RepID=UPI0008FF4DFC|nr:olfactory receptor 2T1 [Fukomys damarensis]
MLTGPHALYVKWSLSFGMIEYVLLGVMAYDRYVAICHPLHYTVTMDRNTCVKLAAVSWCSSFLSAMSICVLTLALPYCGPNVLNHFFCEVPSVLRLACTDTSLAELVVFIFSILLVFIPFLLIVVSYVRILLSVQRMRSASGRHKALSTCASHLTVVALFYGTAIFMYMRPQSKSSRAGGKVIAVFYTVATPMLNPLIYSLRNQDVKGALKRALAKQRKQVHKRMAGITAEREEFRRSSVDISRRAVSMWAQVQAPKAGSDEDSLALKHWVYQS